LIEIITPNAEKEKGCQVSMLMLEKGKEVFEALKAAWCAGRLERTQCDTCGAGAIVQYFY
jgi:kynureninase